MERDMTCRDFREVHPDLDVAARRHLDGCVECRTLVRTWELLGELESIRPRPGFLSRLRRRLAPRRVRLLAPLGAAAAALLVAVVVFQQPVPATPAERELVENLEILENLELLQSLELLSEDTWPLGENGR